MSKKRDKKILRLLNAQRTPKRIAGVKIPKTLRRWSDSQLGSAIIAHVALNAGGAALASPAGLMIQRQAEKARRQVITSISNTFGAFAAPDDEGMNGSGMAEGDERAH